MNLTTDQALRYAILQVVITRAPSEDRILPLAEACFNYIKTGNVA